MEQDHTNAAQEEELSIMSAYAEELALLIHDDGALLHEDDDEKRFTNLLRYMFGQGYLHGETAERERQAAQAQQQADAEAGSMDAE